MQRSQGNLNYYTVFLYMGLKQYADQA